MAAGFVHVPVTVVVVVVIVCGRVVASVVIGISQTGTADSRVQMPSRLASWSTGITELARIGTADARILVQVEFVLVTGKLARLVKKVRTDTTVG